MSSSPWRRIRPQRLARAVPLPAELQVELLVGGGGIAEAVASNPSLLPDAVGEALDVAGDAASGVADSVVGGAVFDALPLDLAVRCVHSASWGFDSWGPVGLALVLARRRELADAVLEAALPTPGWVAALCQLHVDWHAPRWDSVISRIDPRNVQSFTEATQGRELNDEWKGPGLLPAWAGRPGGADVKALVRIIEAGAGRRVVGARLLLIAASLAADPADPSGASAAVFRWHRRPSRHLAWLNPQAAEVVAALDASSDVSAFSEAFAGGDTASLRVALMLVADGFTGTPADLADLAAAVRR